MKRIFSFLLAAVLLVSAVPTALATNDYTQGTQVVYTATGSESYTITVPALLAPGGNGTVTLQGTWADNRIVTVTADPTVTLTNSIKAEDQKVLNVHFDGISEAGSNTGSQTFTENVSVDNITDALFGTWSGKFNYNVGVTDDVLKGNRIAVFGTSISSGVVNSPETYCMKIADNNDMELSIYAYGGDNILKTLSKYRTQEVQNTLASYTENDFVIVDGLLNSIALELGEITPVGTTTFDETTTIGALESLLYHYTNSGYRAKIGFVLTNFSTKGYTEPELIDKYNNVWDTAITVLEKYNISYIDLRDKASTGVTLPDGVHPDNAGHIKMAELVEAWLKTI